MLSLNLGCGTNHMTHEGVVNIDCEECVKPDLLFNFTSGNRLPWADHTVDEIYIFHTIEHINKRKHAGLFFEINRLLKDDGLLLMSYPEFEKICRCWLSNFQGRRAFWEATIYGRQLYPSDAHVCAMSSEYYVRDILEKCGFYAIKFEPERAEVYNTICRAQRTEPQISYEQVLYNEVCA